MAEPSQSEVKKRLQLMDPYQFEKLVGEVWEAQGFKTEVKKSSGDKGIDIEATKKSPFSQKVLIQAKRYSGDNKIGSKEVRTYATLYQQVSNVDMVVLVTTGETTPQARDLAQDLDVKIVDGDAISEMTLDSVDDIEDFNLVDDVEDINSVDDVEDINYSGNKPKDNTQYSVKESPFNNSKNWKNVNPNQTHFEKCPECDSESVWFGRLKSDRHVKCESCNSKWRREEIEQEEGWWVFTVSDTELGWREVEGPNQGKFQSKSEWKSE